MFEKTKKTSYNKSIRLTKGGEVDLRKIGIGKWQFDSLIKENLLYVDKTLFIKDFLEDGADVLLITRPRRFGKTLNLNTLNNFLNISLDNKKLFEGLNISKYPDILDKHLNKYPVILLNLKSVLGKNITIFRNNLLRLLASYHKVFSKTHDLSVFSEADQNEINQIIRKDIDDALIHDSLKNLTSLLYEYYNQKVILLIDEYDSPLESAYANEYYGDAVKLIGPFFSNALKDNDYLEKALLVGCSKVAQAGIFSGVNNLSVCTMQDIKYSQYFGFTEDEVKQALKEYELSDTFDEVKRWYDGYRIGDLSLYNPWSITQYLDKQEFRPYWVNTSSLDFIQSLLMKIDYENLFSTLLSDISVIAEYTEQITYKKKKASYSDIVSLLYQAGYLNMVNKNEFKIVNHEVFTTIRDTFSNCLIAEKKLPKYYQFFDELFELNIKEAQNLFNDAIKKATFYDHENYYYGILDQLSLIINNYTSYREFPSVNGRSDFVIKSQGKVHAFVIEVKKVKKEKGTISPEDINKEIVDALEQIESNNYVTHLELEGYRSIYKVALVIADGKTHIRFRDDPKNKYNDKLSEYLVKKMFN